MLKPWQTRQVNTQPAKTGSSANGARSNDHRFSPYNLATATYIFDKFEAGLTEGFPGIWNITAVDFVAVPMQLSCNGKKVGFKDGVSSIGLQQKLSALGAPYSNGASHAPNNNRHWKDSIFKHFIKIFCYNPFVILSAFWNKTK